MRPTYTCENCGETYEYAWSDEEARAEEAATFGSNDPDAAIVCEDCYRKIMGETR